MPMTLMRHSELLLDACRSRIVPSSVCAGPVSLGTVGSSKAETVARPVDPSSSHSPVRKGRSAGLS